ncbi:hypothetical protein Leryth_012720 [Lithospermum erythrorhizon]|nr:hypothetical protein Leryth_012720 [Lithospermum erythrorhizon]
MHRRPPRPPPSLPSKGTVTPLSSIFPVEEAQKASQRVHHTLTQTQTQLDTLHNFISDNSSLIDLVKRLPHDLHHSIMVPFGPAAFFPGKIIHTNELMVLLGEGYYAERTAKQTVDILQRRGKGLESQVEGVKAVMDDLKAEASFFDATANEAAEGIVEIREDYVEETSPSEEFAPSVLKSDSVNPQTNEASGATEDDKFNRILSRLAELEKEEEEAEEGIEIEEEDEENYSNEDPQLSLSQHTIIKGGKSSEVRVSLDCFNQIQ